MPSPGQTLHVSKMARASPQDRPHAAEVVLMPQGEGKSKVPAEAGPHSKLAHLLVPSSGQGAGDDVFWFWARPVSVRTQTLSL